MSTFGQTLGTGWTADTNVFTANLPGDYMSAGKTYGPADKWAMDRSFSRLFFPIDYPNNYFNVNRDSFENTKKKLLLELVATTFSFKASKS